MRDNAQEQGETNFHRPTLLVWDHWRFFSLCHVSERQLPRREREREREREKGERARGGKGKVSEAREFSHTNRNRIQMWYMPDSCWILSAIKAFFCVSAVIQS